MDDPRPRAMELFRAACVLNDEQRRVFLDNECGEDSALRSEVESLIENYDEPPTIPPPPQAFPDPGDDRPRRVPKEIGPYRIVREIGRGGMGVVYLGVREGDRFRQRVAVKVLKPGMDTTEILQRFDQERQVLAALNHPGVARLFDAGETTERLPYFAMEYIEGQPIDEYCDTHRLEIAERLELFRQVCEAVQYVHRNLMVHRDLKPSNIIVTGDGRTKLLDFGIAKLTNPEMSFYVGDPTAPEVRVMTPEYASPEQVRGNPITVASDIYSLGVILYELVTGHRPYRLKNRLRAELERVICDVEPDRPSTAASRVEVIETDGQGEGESSTITPETVAKMRGGGPQRLRRRLTGDIDNVVLMAIRKEPQRRYLSAEQFGEDIRRHLAGLPVIARRDTAGYRLAKYIRRNRWGVASAAVVTLALVGWAITAAYGWAAEIRHNDRNTRILAELFVMTDAFADFHGEIKRRGGSLAARGELAEVTQASLEVLAGDVGRDPQLLRRLATAYDMVGDIWAPGRGEAYGDTSIALANYRTAMSLRQELLADHADDVELRRAIAKGYWRIGIVLRFTGDVEGALAAHRKDLEISETLVGAHSESHRDLYVGLADVGAIFKDLGRLADARDHYERSLAVREQNLRGNPDDTGAIRAVAVGLIHVAEAKDLTGDVEGALELYLRTIPLREKVVRREPERGRDQRYLAVSHRFAARALLALDRPEEAVPHAEFAVAAFRQLASENPLSAGAKRDVAIGVSMRGRLHAALGEPNAALESFRGYEASMRRLHERDPDNVQYTELLAESLEEIGQTYGALGEWSAAVWSCREGLDLVKPCAERDRSDVDLQLQLARNLSTLGELLIGGAELLEAKSPLTDARAIQETVLESRQEHARARDGLVLTLRRLSRLSLERSYADEALAHAQEALQIATRRDAAVLRDLAAALAARGDGIEAVTVAGEALELLAGSNGPAAQALRARLQEDLVAYKS